MAELSLEEFERGVRPQTGGTATLEGPREMTLEDFERGPAPTPQPPALGPGQQFGPAGEVITPSPPEVLTGAEKQEFDFQRRSSELSAMAEAVRAAKTPQATQQATAQLEALRTRTSQVALDRISEQERRQAIVRKGPITDIERLRRTKLVKALPFIGQMYKIAKQASVHDDIIFLQGVQRQQREFQEQLDQLNAAASLPADQERYRETLNTFLADPKNFDFSGSEAARRLTGYLEEIEERSLRGETIGAKIIEGATELPAYMLEFLATGGIAAIGSKAGRRIAIKMLGRHARRRGLRTLTKGLGWAVGGVFRTAAMPHRVGAATAERITPRFNLTDEGKVIILEAGEKPATAFFKAFGDVFIENLSETAGRNIARLIGKVPVAGRMFQAIEAELANFTGGARALKALRRGGYDGLLSEIGEERLGDIMRAVTGIEDFGVDDENNSIFERMIASIPSGEDFIVELGVLAAPTIGGAVVSRAKRAVTKAAPEVEEPAPAEPAAPAEAPTAPPEAPTEPVQPVTPEKVAEIPPVAEEVAEEAPAAVEPAEAPPAKKPKRKLKEVFLTKKPLQTSRAKLEDQIVAWHEQNLGPVEEGADLATEISRLTDGQFDSMTTSFAGKIPAELKEGLAGRKDVRVKLTPNVPQAVGEDFVAAVGGTEAYLNLLASVRRGRVGDIRIALAAVKKAAKDAGDAAMLSKIAQYEARGNIETINVADLEVGDTVEIDGEVHLVRKSAEPEMLLLENGVRGSVHISETVAIDKGSLNRPGAKVAEPAEIPTVPAEPVEAAPVAPTDLFGEAAAPRPISGRTADLGIGRGEVTEVGVGEVAIKAELRAEALRLLQDTAFGKDWRAGKGLATDAAQDLVLAIRKEHKAKADAFFNVATNELAEAQEALIQATRGGTLFAPVEKPKKKRIVSDEAMTKAKANILNKLPNERTGRMGMNIDPTILKDLVVVGTGYVERGLTAFVDWSAQMVQDFGESISGDLQELWGHMREGKATADETLISLDKAGSLAKKDATSIKNAVVDAELGALGLPPAQHGQTVSFQESADEAAAAFKADPFVGQSLVRELMVHPRPPTALEDAILLHEQVRVRNNRVKAETDYAEAHARGDTEAAAVARNALDKAIKDFEVIADVVTRVGTASALSLGHRRMMMRDDFTLEAMVRRAVTANAGKPLDSKQKAEIKRLHATIAEKDRQLGLRQAEVERLQAEAMSKATHRDLVAEAKREAKPRPRKPAEGRPSVRSGAKNRIFTLKMADAARARLRENLARLNVNPLDPGILRDLVIVGAHNIERGIRTFAEWSRTMVEDLGTTIQPHLQAIWDESQIHFTEQRQSRVNDRISKGADRGRSVVEMHAAVRELAKVFIESGITEREKLIDAVHEALQEIDAGITRRETMDAISGYGIRQTLTKDDISVQLRDLGGQMQQIAKLEDMQAGHAPLKTGPERRAPSDEERRLVALVNEMKRRGDYVVNDPAVQLKSTLDSIKTRLRNQIVDLEDQINSRERLVTEITPPPTDVEVESLRERRDVLKEQFDEIFGTAKRELTDEQRVEIAVRSTERSIEEFERRIREGDLFPTRKTAKVPKSVKVDALRARRDALFQELHELREAAKPKRTAEEIALQAYKTRTRNQIADFQERLAQGNFAPRTRVRRHIQDDAESQRLRFEKDNAQARYNEALFKYKLKNRNALQKVFGAVGEVANTSRSIITSFDVSAPFRQGIVTFLAHPRIGTRAMRDMFRALRSEKKRHAIDAALRDRPNAALYKSSGLELTERGVSLSKMEEAYQSRWADKIPGVGASERAFSTYLNVLRADAFDALVASLGQGEVTKVEARLLAHYVNAATGRGTLGRNDSVLAGLATVFFSPRLVISRFQLLLGEPLWRPQWKGSFRARKLIAKEYGRFLLGAAVVIGLGLMLGADFEKDPRSTNFGKLKFGKTRLDPFGGLLQVITLIARIVTGKRKTLSGDIVNTWGEVPYGQANTAGIIGRFFRSKLSPAAGAALNAVTGTDYIGKAVTPTSIASNLTVPMSFREIKEAMQAEGATKGAALGILNLLGMGLSSYDHPKIRALQALRAGDKAEVQRILDEYNPNRPEDEDFLKFSDIEKSMKSYDARRLGRARREAARALIDGDKAEAKEIIAEYMRTKTKQQKALTLSDAKSEAEKIKAKRTGKAVPGTGGASFRRPSPTRRRTRLR